MYRIFLNSAKSCILSCLSKLDVKKKIHCAILKYKRLKLKLRVFLAGPSVAMVTYCVTKMIPTCSSFALHLENNEPQMLLIPKVTRVSESITILYCAQCSNSLRAYRVFTANKCEFPWLPWFCLKESSDIIKIYVKEVCII